MLLVISLLIIIFITINSYTLIILNYISLLLIIIIFNSRKVRLKPLKKE